MGGMCRAIGNGLIGAALCLGILCWGAVGSSESSVPSDDGKAIRQTCVGGGHPCGGDRTMAEARPASEVFGEGTGEPIVHRDAMQSVSSHGDQATGQEAIPAASAAGDGGESGPSLVSRYVIAVLAALVGSVVLSRRRVS